MRNNVEIIECPRDAIQGWKNIISTSNKIEYLNALLKVGFHTLDFGSFVSPKAIPQMADTKEVVSKLNLHSSKTKLLAIVANTRGASEAIVFDEITYLGFPFSVSPTFQLRNTNSSIEESFLTVQAIQDLCIRNDKKAVVYLSMGFGNPYGDAYSPDIVLKWAEKMIGLGIGIISVADTVGLANHSEITSLLDLLIPAYPGVQIGVHLHSDPNNWISKVDAALKAGCQRFDGTIGGIGGCPMANDTLVGNIDTAQLISFLENQGLYTRLDQDALQNCITMAGRIFQ